MKQSRAPGIAVFSMLSMLCWLATPSTVQAEPCPPEWSPAFQYDTGLYPFSHHCLALGQGLMHYIDESPAALPLATVLMLHGNPTWSFLYREIVPLLVARGFRVIAPDYLGFGLSDKPAPETFGYTPAEHADTIEQLVVALDLDQVVMLLQDWGGPIGVTVAGRQFARMRGLVLMNTFFEALNADEPGHNHLAVDFSLRNIRDEDALRNSGEFPRQIGFALAWLNAAPGTAGFAAVLDAYWGPFLNQVSGLPLSPEIVAPTNIFAQNLLLSAGWMQDADNLLHAGMGGLPIYILWGREDNLWGALQCDQGTEPQCPYDLQCTQVTGSSLCLEADGDPFFPQITHLQRILPRGVLQGTTIADRGTHFVQESEPGMIARAVRYVHETAGTVRPAQPR